MTTLKYYLRLLDNTFEFIENYVNLLEADNALKFEHKERWNKLISEMRYRSLLVAHLHFSYARSQAKKSERAPKQTHQDAVNKAQTGHDRRTPARNSAYKKLAVLWLNEVLCFVSSFSVADSFRLRNCQLPAAANL